MTVAAGTRTNAISHVRSAAERVASRRDADVLAVRSQPGDNVVAVLIAFGAQPSYDRLVLVVVPPNCGDIHGFINSKVEKVQ